MPTIATKKILGYLEIAIAVFLWATIEITMHSIRDQTNAIIILFFRFSIGSIFLLLLIVITNRLDNLMILIKNYPKYYLPAGILGLTCGMWLFSYGTLKTNPASAATIISSNPIFIALFMIFFRKETKSITKLLGIILGFFGIILIISDGNFTNFFLNQDVVGNFLVLLGTILWVINLIIGKILLSDIIPKYDPTNPNSPKVIISSLEFNALTFFITSICVMPFMFTKNQINLISNFTLWTWGGLLFLGLIPTGIAYLLYFNGLKKLQASKGANLFYLKPIFAIFLSLILFQLEISLFFYLGILIEIVALILITFEPKISKSGPSYQIQSR